MSFFYPILWLGALGIGVPIWLHLRRKTPKSLVHFSALRFLEDLPEPRQGHAQIREPLLFALRVLALLSLVAAFAWPFFRESAPVVTASRVHILDATLSQQAGEGFAADRDALVDALRDAGDNTQDAVVLLDARPRVVAGFGEDPSEALRLVRTLEPSHQRGSYLEAFRLAATLLEQSLGSERQILLYGDHQANQWSEHTASPPFLRDVEVILAGTAAGDPQPNLALHEPRARYFFLGDKTLVDLTFDLHHQGVREPPRVVLQANGLEVFNDQVLVEGRPPRLALSAQWETDPDLWLEGRVTLAESRGDALGADDSSYFTVPPVREGRLALLARSPFLRAALAPEVMRGRWQTELLNPVDVDPDAPLAELADVLLVEVSYVQSQRVRDLLLRYLNNERGVILLLDRVTPLVKGFLRELGFEVVGEPRAQSQPFRYFNVYHPIFRPFAQGELGDLMQVLVHEHVPLRSRKALPLIYGAAGGGLLAEGLKTKGRLLVFTFGFHLEATDWPIKPSFIPFLDLTLQHVRGATELQTSWEPGELYSMTLEKDTMTTGQDFAVVHRRGEDGRADEEVLRLDLEENGDERTLRFRISDRPGIYTVSLNGETLIQKLAVNPAPEESSLVYDPTPDALNAWTLPGDVQTEAQDSRPEMEIVALSEVLLQKIWWWLLLAGLVILSLESALLARSTLLARRSSQ